MRVIHRNVAGAYIFSKDEKLLLGRNRKNGVYRDILSTPAGGIEEGETKLEAVIREVLEETGIDISNQRIEPIEVVRTGESTKRLDSGETVKVKMKFDDDLEWAEWYAATDIPLDNIGENTRQVLTGLNYV